MKRSTPLQRFTRLETHTPLRARRPKDDVNHGPRSSKRLYVGPAAETQPLVASQGQQAIDLPKYPKPARRKTASAPIKRSWMRKGARKSKHARRERELGYMHFCHDRGCELALDRDTQRILGISHDCSFEPVEFAHLHDRRRYAPGDIGAGLDRTTHLGIDGKPGGKAPWYVALDRPGQSLIRMRLANRSRRAWDALSDHERADWERKAREFLAARRAAA